VTRREYSVLELIRRPDVAARFWEKVQKTDGCWLWTAAVKDGKHAYGIFGVKAGLYPRAHRVSWMMHHDAVVPNGLCVLHECDTPRCVRPDHLFLGTRADNAADMVAKGRGHLGEKDGNAKLTESAVQAIRELAAKRVPQTRIAAMFGIAQSTVSKIALGYRWRHVA
jgi:hypothetical protein